MVDTGAKVKSGIVCGGMGIGFIEERFVFAPIDPGLRPPEMYNFGESDGPEP